MIETKFSNCIFPFCKRVKSGPKIARKAYKMDFSDGLGGVAGSPLNLRKLKAVEISSLKQTKHCLP
jgi:hypothetical protein